MPPRQIEGTQGKRAGVSRHAAPTAFEDDIFRSESGERGSAVTSGGPGIQAVKQASKQAVSQALARAHAERQCPLERLVAPLCNIQI
jgi:hypothetical protein